MDVNKYSQEEVQIALNLVQHIHNKDLNQCSISSLDRIIHIYYLQNNHNKTEEKQVIEFLFQCLDDYGPDASILFSYLSKSSERENVIKKLYEDYKEKFDFNFINSSLFESSYKMLKDRQKNKIINFFFLLVFLIIIPLSISFYLRYRELELMKNKEEIVKFKIPVKSEIVGYGPNAKKINYFEDHKMYKFVDSNGKETFSDYEIINSYQEEIKPKIKEKIINNFFVKSEIVGKEEKAKKIYYFENRKIQQYVDMNTMEIVENIIVLDSFVKVEYTSINETIQNKVQVNEETFGEGSNEQKIIYYEDQKILNYFDLNTGQNKNKKIIIRSYTEKIHSKVEKETKIEKYEFKEPVMKVEYTMKVNHYGKKKNLNCKDIDYYKINTFISTYEHDVIVSPNGILHFSEWRKIKEDFSTSKA